MCGQVAYSSTSIAIAYCYCVLLLPIACCYCLLLLPIAIAHCSCRLLLLVVIAYGHCMLLLPLAIACCYCPLPLPIMLFPSAGAQGSSLSTRAPVQRPIRAQQALQGQVHLSGPRGSWTPSCPEARARRVPIIPWVPGPRSTTRT